MVMTRILILPMVVTEIDLLVLGLKGQKLCTCVHIQLLEYIKYTDLYYIVPLAIGSNLRQGMGVMTETVQETEKENNYLLLSLQ